MTRLYIKDSEAELSKEAIIQVTHQVNDMGELKDRQMTFSNTFELQRTKANSKIFEDANLIPTAGERPYQQLQTTVKRKGITTCRGFTVLEDAGQTFRARIKGEVSDFFSKIEDKKLCDLDFSDLNHVA